VNFFLGWSLVGWIVSLIWALSSENTFQKVEVKNPIPHLVEKSSSHQEISFDEKDPNYTFYFFAQNYLSTLLVSYNLIDY
jgi:hypothetical protein